MLLAGYSFGADVLPDAFLALPPEVQARVRQVSLLGLSPQADWEITVAGWLGSSSSAATPTPPSLARLPTDRVQCIYGAAETDSPRPALAAAGAEAIETKGGHHFDGNYQALADAIPLAGLDRRRAHHPRPARPHRRERRGGVTRPRLPVRAPRRHSRRNDRSRRRMAKDNIFAKPFDGAVSRFVEKEAPKDVREALKDADKHDILDPRYPYQQRLDDEAYEEAYDRCQLELVKAQKWYRETGRRIVILFEGRDAAGKGGAIQAFTENLNPRSARIVALPAPSDVERGQWYFQRYIAHLPTAAKSSSSTAPGTIAPSSSMSSAGARGERERFFAQVPEFENALVSEGIVLVKLWLAIGRAEELRQFLQRERDPLKQWKLSQTDIDGLSRWDDYTAAIAEMFARSHHAAAPWTVIWSEDKRRARIAAMQAVLTRLDYPGKAVTAPTR